MSGIDQYPGFNSSTANAVLGYLSNTINALDVTTEVTLASVTVFVPAGRVIKVTAAAMPESTVAGDRTRLTLKEDGVTVLYRDRRANASGVEEELTAITVLYPTPGVHTYAATLQRAAGTGTVTNIATSTNPSFILVEDITGGTGGPGPIQLAHVKVESAQAGITAADLTGLTATINVPAGRSIRLYGEAFFGGTVAGDRAYLNIMEGVTTYQQGNVHLAVVQGTDVYKVTASAVIFPTAGTHTYKLNAARAGTGTISLSAGEHYPAFLLVEDITGTPATPGYQSSGIWAPGASFPSTPAEGDLFYETDTDILWAWDGAAWTIPNQTEGSFTPQFLANGGNPNLGTTGGTLGYWQKTGNQVQVWGWVKFEGTGVTAGTGIYYTVPPISINTSKIGASGSGTPVMPVWRANLGGFHLSDSSVSTNTFNGICSAWTATQVGFHFPAGGMGFMASTSGMAFMPFAVNDIITFEYSYPI